MYEYVHSVQIYSVRKFITVIVIKSSILGLLMQEFIKSRENLQNWFFFENPYFCPEQWSMVRPTTYLVHGIWMYGCTDYGHPMKPFSSKSQTFGIGQTNWTDKFLDIWGIFGQTISTHFGTVSPVSMFSINQS